MQALYQMEVSGAGTETVVREFADHRFGGDMEGEALARVNFTLLTGEDYQGYVKDGGQVYGPRNNLEYGWTQDNVATARDRDDTSAPAKLYVATYPLTRQPAAFADVAREP